MKHARADYNRIQDPHGLIPENEPVFLLRAQDLVAPGAVRAWARDAHEAGADMQLVVAALSQARAMESWQRTVARKIPDLAPASTMNGPASPEERAAAWVTRCFGEEAMGLRERAARLLEEVVEFAQAVGVDRAVAERTVAHVYSQDPGDAEQELGGIMLTAACCAKRLGTSMADAFRIEMERVESKTAEHFRTRQQRKADLGMSEPRREGAVLPISRASVEQLSASLPSDPEFATLDDYLRAHARPAEEWREEIGDVLWWTLPVEEPPYVGGPNDAGYPVTVEVTMPGPEGPTSVTNTHYVGGWPGYHTHWTHIPGTQIGRRR